MLEVIKPGLETSIQDYPGRIGYWNQGFPPSGPMDSWSFRLANILVGNDLGAPGLEAQYMGENKNLYHLQHQNFYLILQCCDITFVLIFQHDA